MKAPAKVFAFLLVFFISVHSSASKAEMSNAADRSSNLPVEGTLGQRVRVIDNIGLAGSAPLVVKINGKGKVTPEYNGVLLEIGKTYKMKAIPGPGCAFAGWTGSVTSRPATLTFVMQANLAFTANFVDVQRPTVAILTPKTGQHLTAAATSVTGTASDNVQVSNVFYQLNADAWTKASTTNGGANWTANVTLAPGPNVVRAYAVDSTGNVSATKTVKLLYVVTYAFDYIGPYLTSQIITYTDKSKQTVQASGFPGQVQLIFKNKTSVLTAQTFVNSKGGKVIAQIPYWGYYLVSVPPGGEGDFIAAANAKPNVLLAIPSGPLALSSAVVDVHDILGPSGELPAVPNLTAQVGDNTYLYVVDGFQLNPQNWIDECNPPKPHGVAVDFVASKALSGTGQQLDIPLDGATVTPNDLTSAEAILLKDAPWTSGGRAVVNMSIGANAATEQLYRQDQESFLEKMATDLNNLLSSPDKSMRDAALKIVYVVSAGNGVGNTGENGIDLSEAIARLHKKYPAVFTLGGGPHLIIVGGEGTTDGIYDNGMNYSSVKADANGNPLMVYAPARQVPVCASGCKVDGTSFAAPAVSGVIAQVLSANPDSTAAQVTHAFMLAALNNNYQLPSVNDVKAILDSPGGYYVLSIAHAGTGTGTVTANPPGPAYPKGTVVTLTAAADSDSTFAGWSGAASGKGDAAVTMTANKSVTATFKLSTGPVNRFDGLYWGFYEGIWEDADGYIYPFDLASFNCEVSRGVIEVQFQNGGTGVVSSDGSFSTTCNVGSAAYPKIWTWSGTLSVSSDGTRTGSGTWSREAPYELFIRGSGVWTAEQYLGP